ncbi:AGAP007269-PA-like protein [Anopheles sinensis]|uniref:AGAP007269-PA-like protein n=1 Tax=Anopheles sinensis TaxID=74873 RepID=A0A084VQU2_ANOSI|nr:AGAP007269-PA-like protein [Anopheles sinensis]
MEHILTAPTSWPTVMIAVPVLSVGARRRDRKVLYGSRYAASPEVTLAKPDFGIPGPVQDSATVRLAAIELGRAFERLQANLELEIPAPSNVLEQLFVVLQTITDTVGPLGVSASAALAAATLSMADIKGTFHDILDPLIDLQTAVVVQIPELLLAINELAGSALVLQIMDEFSMIYVSTRTLIGAVIQLAANVQSVSNPSEVNESVITGVLRAMQLLRSNIELLSYTIGSTSTELRIANEFLEELKATRNMTKADNRAALDRFRSKLDRFEDSLTYLTDCLLSEYVDLRPYVSSYLESLGTSSGECVLHSAAESLVDSVTTGWDRAVCVVKRHYKMLGRKCELVKDLSESYEQVHEFGMALAQTAVANGPNAPYCFHKFFRLVEHLLLRLADDASLCLKQESTRLRSLQESVQNMFPTVVYDVEELLAHLELCGEVLEKRHRCISEFGELYEHLASHTEQKLELIEKFSLAETSASADRLKLCVLHSRYNVLHLELARLQNELEECSSFGGSLCEEPTPYV